MASEQDDFLDRVAQAVIDKIEQRDETAHLVNQVALRVMELQKRDADLKAKAAQEVGSLLESSNNVAGTGNNTKEVED